MSFSLVCILLLIGNYGISGLDNNEIDHKDDGLNDIEVNPFNDDQNESKEEDGKREDSLEILDDNVSVNPEPENSKKHYPHNFHPYAYYFYHYPNMNDTYDSTGDQSSGSDYYYNDYDYMDYDYNSWYPFYNYFDSYYHHYYDYGDYNYNYYDYDDYNFDYYDYFDSIYGNSDNIYNDNYVIEFCKYYLEKSEVEDDNFSAETTESSSLPDLPQPHPMLRLHYKLVEDIKANSKRMTQKKQKKLEKEKRKLRKIEKKIKMSKKDNKKNKPNKSKTEVNKKKDKTSKREKSRNNSNKLPKANNRLGSRNLNKQRGNKIKRIQRKGIRRNKKPSQNKLSKKNIKLKNVPRKTEKRVKEEKPTSSTKRFKPKAKNKPLARKKRSKQMIPSRIGPNRGRRQQRQRRVGGNQNHVTWHRGKKGAKAPKPKKDTKDCECGHHSLSQRMLQESKIINGHKTENAEYPFMVSIQFYPEMFHFCGGSIITDTFILTAAHCTYGKGENEMIIVVGEYDLSKDSEGKEKQHKIKTIIVHPSYDDTFLLNDISLVELIKPIAYNDHVQPICLTLGDFTFYKEKAYSMGWGVTKPTKKKPGKVIRHILLKVLTMRVCKDSYSDTIFPLKSSMFCAQGEDQDTCQGDSGGPIVWLSEKDNRYMQIGVVSWGLGCNDPDYPGVYTKLQHYLQWIYDITKDSTYCQGFTPNHGKVKSGKGKRKNRGRSV